MSKMAVSTLRRRVNDILYITLQGYKGLDQFKKEKNLTVRKKLSERLERTLIGICGADKSLFTDFKELLYTSHATLKCVKHAVPDLGTLLRTFKWGVSHQSTGN